MRLRAADILPVDGCAGTLVGRIWTDGPRVVAVRDDGLFDLSRLAPTMSDLVDLPDAAGAVGGHAGERLCGLDEALARGALLAPCDLAAIKAAGVTFADSLIERVIEERAKGDAAAANALRAELTGLLGGSLTGLKPGSPAAMALKAALIERGLWSQYLEVGIGPDAEIFTKGPLLSAIGWGGAIGVRGDSDWNNPEPEVVLVCDGGGGIRGAALGNDVNLRDFEGRSALLLAKAKDNNASCAIGPFIRLFDDRFSLDDVRSAVIRLEIDGPEGFRLEGSSSMAMISRDPADLVGQAIGANHQYPDGFALFLGTMFAPIQDRDAPGRGFTHKVGDRVRVMTAGLGVLENQVTHCADAPPWKFGVSALMHNLAGRGLLKA